MPHRLLNHCQTCRAVIASYWTHCHDCRHVIKAQAVARAKAAMPRPQLPLGEPGDVLGYWGGMV